MQIKKMHLYYVFSDEIVEAQSIPLAGLRYHYSSAQPTVKDSDRKITNYFLGTLKLRECAETKLFLLRKQNDYS